MDRLTSHIDADRIWREIEAFAEIGKNGQGGVSRLAFSREDAEAREKIMRILTDELKLPIRIDPLGNIFARREGKRPDWPVIMTGSHLDSVRNGGMFDGVAGVICSLEAFRVMDQLELETEHPFELVVFASEEPNKFGLSTLGSRGIVGKIRKEELEFLRDDDGNEFRKALAVIGGDLDRIEEAVRKTSEIEYFVEVHIEQMPTLHQQKRDVAIVSEAGGIYRERISIGGVAGHSGTTPMAARHDALCAASTIILTLEKTALEEADLAVATVGRIKVSPNTVGIIPGIVEIDTEIRSIRQEIIQRIARAVEDMASKVAEERKVRISKRVIYETHPISFSADVREAIRAAAESLGLKTLELFSMAGHDAVHISAIAKSGMIFIPSRNGFSHCPEEWTIKEDLGKGAQCLLKTLLLLDKKDQRLS
ncbi:MAG: M20 family metallo-hydrolase [Thermodesulfobacteriota bacterium]